MHEQILKQLQEQLQLNIFQQSQLMQQQQQQQNKLESLQRESSRSTSPSSGKDIGVTSMNVNGLGWIGTARDAGLDPGETNSFRVSLCRSGLKPGAPLLLKLTVI